VSVVPVGTPWVAEIRVANRDVGLITTGLAVKLKLDAFPFVDFGYLQATVTEVLPDAEPSPTPGGPTVYRVLAALDNVQFKFRKGGQQLPLRSGLTGTAEIVTDRKTLWQLLLNPLQREFQEANPAQP
jgi:hemolysin D